MAEKKKKTTVAAVEELAIPIAESLDLELWDIQFVKEGASWYLRIYIDKPGGVNIDDCEQMSRAIDGPLDEEDLIAQSYYLEVSSPGIERKLVRDEHFEKKIGEKVKVHMIRPIDNVRDFEGVLTDYTNGMVTITLADDETMSFDKKDASWIKLDDFGGF